MFAATTTGAKKQKSGLRKALWHKARAGSKSSSIDDPAQDSAGSPTKFNKSVESENPPVSSAPNSPHSPSINIEGEPLAATQIAPAGARVHRQHSSTSSTSIPENEALETTNKSNRPPSRLSIRESLRSRIPPIFSSRNRVKSANPVLLGSAMPALTLDSPTTADSYDDDDGDSMMPKSPLSVSIDCEGEESGGGGLTSPNSPLSATGSNKHAKSHLHYSASERYDRSGALSPRSPGGGSLLSPLKASRSVGANELVSGKRSNLTPRYSPNPYLASLSDHPTIFEDLYSNLDGQSQESVYSLFMKAHKCYDIIPTSAKLIVFDTELQVSKAFFALVYNGVRAAPIYDSKERKFVGMLTITDFIQILNKYYTKKGEVSKGIEELERHKVCTWRSVFKEEGRLKPFTYIDPRESLYRAVEILCEQKIHRLPVLEHDTANILYILTHKRIIKFLFLYLADLPKPPFMEKTPKELEIGSWENICTISKDTLLIDALKIFLEKRVSALPLLDADGRVVDIYAKFDVINLAAEKSYNDLDVTVYEALKHRSDWFEGVRKCYVEDSLWTVIDIIVKAEVHRLIVTDRKERVVGIISLSDILKHLVLEPPGLEKSTTNVPIGVVFKGGESARDLSAN